MSIAFLLLLIFCYWPFSMVDVGTQRSLTRNFVPKFWPRFYRGDSLVHGLRLRNFRNRSITWFLRCEMCWECNQKISISDVLMNAAKFSGWIMQNLINDGWINNACLLIIIGLCEVVYINWSSFMFRPGPNMVEKIHLRFRIKVPNCLITNKFLV